MSMQKLFDRLRELDPDAYRHFRVICNMTAFDYSPLDDPDITTPVYGWCLQGAIQDAIRGRGWGCYQYHYRHDALPEGKKSEFAYISTADSLSSAEADTPAEALLAAYVAALEA